VFAPLAATLPPHGTVTMLSSTVVTTVAAAAPVTFDDISNVLSSTAITQPVNTVPAIAPSSSASSLPVGMSVSSSPVSSSQPAYQPMVVVNTPRFVHIMVRLAGLVSAIISNAWPK